MSDKAVDTHRFVVGQLHRPGSLLSPRPLLAHLPFSPARRGPWQMLQRDPGEQTSSCCLLPGESTLSPGPGGEGPEEGQVRGLRRASSHVPSRPTSSSDGGREPRTLHFYFKANVRAFAQGLSGQLPRWFSCALHLFPQCQGAGPAVLGGPKVPGGRVTGIFWSRAESQYFHLGKGFQGPPEAPPALSQVFPMSGSVCVQTRVSGGCRTRGSEPGRALL